MSDEAKICNLPGDSNNASPEHFKVGERVIYNWVADERHFEGCDPNDPPEMTDVGTIKEVTAEGGYVVHWDCGDEEYVTDDILVRKTLPREMDDHSLADYVQTHIRLIAGYATHVEPYMSELQNRLKEVERAA